MAKKKSSFLGKVTADAKRQKTAGSSYGYLTIPKGITVFSPTPGGRAKFDIIPYEIVNPKHPDKNEELEIAVVDTLWYKRPFKIHRNVGVSRETVICLTSFGKKCPICEYRQKRQSEKADKKELASMRASDRNLYCLVPIGMEDWKEIPHVWDISQFLFQDLLNDELEEDDSYQIFPDLDEGLTLKVRFDETIIEGGKPFATAARIDFEERDATYPEDFLNDVPNLDAMLTELTYKQLEDKFFEMEEEVTGEEPIKEESSSRRVRKIAKEEEKVEEKPATRKRRTPKKEVKESEELQDQGEKVPFVEKKEEPKKRVRRTTKKVEPKVEENKCPHGFEFGVDIDTKDACDICEVWNDCAEAEQSNCAEAEQSNK